MTAKHLLLRYKQDHLLNLLISYIYSYFRCTRANLKELNTWSSYPTQFPALQPSPFPALLKRAAFVYQGNNSPTALLHTTDCTHPGWDCLYNKLSAPYSKTHFFLLKKEKAGGGTKRKGLTLLDSQKGRAQRSQLRARAWSTTPLQMTAIPLESLHLCIINNIFSLHPENVVLYTANKGLFFWFIIKGAEEE